MAKTCPHCGSSSIDVDNEKFAEVCAECGVVLDEGSFDNEPTFTRTAPSCYDTLEAYNWRIKQWKATVLGGSRNYEMIKKVKVQIEKLRLPKDYIQQVITMMDSIIDGRKRHVKKLPRRLDVLIAACIVIVCRTNGVEMEYKTAAGAADCRFSIVIRCVKTIRESLNMEVSSCKSHDDMLDTILTRFDAKNPDIKKLAFGLKNFLDDTFTGVTKNRVNLLIGIAKICIECIQRSKIDNKKLNEVCRHYLCTARQVRIHFHDIKHQLLKYGKQIPWINDIENRTLHYYIKEIVEYYRDFENHKKVNVKNDIMEKNEIAELEKKQMIQDAKERVDACQKNCAKKQQLTNDDILHEQCKSAKLHASCTPQQETSPGLLEKAQGTASYEDHRCCPHCCIKPQGCPKFKQTGMSDFCVINSSGRMIEYLLRNGYSESSLMQGYPKAMFQEVFYQGTKREEEELDEEDMDDDEIYKYIKTPDEMAQSQIHSMFLKEGENDNSS